MEEQEKTPRPRPKIMDAAEPGTIRMKLYEVGWQQERMKSGDYKFFTHDFKRVGITRKGIQDLLNSIGDRFSKQLEEMLDYYDMRIILLEGSWKMVSPTSKIVGPRGIEYYTWSMVWNYLRRWQDKGFTLELTVNEGHTIQRLNELYALYQKPYSRSANTKDFTDDRILAFPSGSRGKTAMDCIAHFGSLVDVAVASPDELVKVNGVGEKKAFLIFNHFNKGVESQTTKETKEIPKTKEEIQQPKLV